MITREQLERIERVIRDLRITLDFKEQADSGHPFVIVPTANPVSIIFDSEKKKEVDNKIIELKKELEEGLVELKQVM